MHRFNYTLLIVLVSTLLVPGNTIAAGSTSVNGSTLTQQQIDTLARQQGIRVIPGTYWYDRKTGAWGELCGPGRGILKAGLEIGGALAADASCGDTGVFVNGRELHRQDLALFQSLAGYIAPGRYWMDAQWNAGFEGGPALVNYAVLAAAAQHSGSGAANPSGGDNFWSSGFSAGNSSADGSQGYVSVPGYGPVGYGF